MKPKQFDPDKAIEIIADSFARNGFEGTSLNTIIKETGLGKQSLYNAFGDKKAMATKSIQCFGKLSNASQILNNPRLNGKERIEDFFQEILKDSQKTNYVGCLMTNLLLEKGNTDQDVQKATNERLTMTKKNLQDVVEIGVTDGSINIPEGLDSELISLSLMNLLNGLRVTIQTKTEIDKIKKMVKISLKSLI
ncbi:TetR/AcrR family transcriptional regulator [Leptospira ilyithenensis]|uniref:TetR/AcrR family transcriptional regulator n=1 Tax=Leptospira ilyithenensis TaxID=2484901 RepID=A0A4R9LPS4_9LEPT|nr:TetR/AcrR family transcriptional regulator [Leptospira ilyithenensis]TGN10087.1 TetR/AcrR family transcriptional regulator [Leptospira ilyithenensis]